MGGTTGQSITLANSIIGVGILAMPFCFQQCGVLLATLILLIMGLVSRLCCYFLLKSAFLARRRNYEFLAFHVFGSAGKLAVEVGIIGFLMGTCIAYFVVVGDLGPQIISKMFNINQSDILRTSIMVIVSLVCVLPLGLLRNVDSLSNVSAATICFYLCLVIKVIAEATSQLPSGDWHRRMELWKPSGMLQCVPIFSMALFCQTQLFEIFESLPSLSLEKMNIVTKNAINICASVYFTLGVFGYIAFCSHDISGNILMSLSPTMASDVIKLGFVMSVAFSFPLIIFPCRASIYSFLYKKVHSSHHDHIINHSIPETTFRCITVGIISVSLFISLLIPNIELVLGLVGSTIGVLICVVFPAACFVNVTFKNTNERLLAKGIIILGLGIMILGTYANLQAAENQIDKYDERYITQDKIDKIVEDFMEKQNKIDDKNLKAITKDEPVAIDVGKVNNIKKDSDLQPPNPVPPESNSNELKDNIENVKQLNGKSNDVLLPEKVKEEAADVVVDSHPKNIKIKQVDNKLANGDSDQVDKVEEKPQEKRASEENKVDKIELIKQQQLIETMKQHGEEQKELMQEQNKILDEIIKNKKEIEKPKEIKPVEIKPEVNKEQQDKETINEHGKQQKLIETIKQHGQEQKELIKEQKEILDELIKTKNEMAQNKEVESEAKKIAVESIKQIADMAIKSIGSVTEKPEGPKEDKNVGRLEKLTNEAVQEIAKKAVEAIHELKNPEDVPADVVSNKEANEIEPKLVQNPNLVKDNVIAPLLNIKPQDNLNQANRIDNVQQQNAKREIQSNFINSQVNEKKGTQDKINSQILNNVVQDTNVIPNVKPHSHSPDEPQSYKLGEDSQMNLEHKLNQNVPLALALSDQAKLDNMQIVRNVQENKIEGLKNVAIENLPHVRDKREVMDCTKPEDKLICDKVLQHENSVEILPKVDLNNELSRFSVDLHHIGRSLKSYDETEKER